MLLVPNVPHYFLAYCFRHKQNHDLKRRTMSTSTLRMHTTLRKVSTMKAFLPLFLLADVLIYFFCQLEFLPPQFIEYFLGELNHILHEMQLFDYRHDLQFYKYIESSHCNLLFPAVPKNVQRVLPTHLIVSFFGNQREHSIIFRKLSAHPKVMFSEGSSDEVVNL